MSSVSGLSPTHRVRARDLAVQAAFLGLRHRDAVHYTQSPQRWEGIARNLKSWRGEYPHYADCSSFATWCLWMGLIHYGVRDVVNDQRWQAGWTGTMVNHGKQVVHRENVRRADLALYGDPVGRSGHVAVCIGGGRIISHGSEGGPYLLDIDYRADLRQIRRYI